MRQFTEEHKLHLSESKRGDKHHLFGKHLSDEHKEKLRDINKGKILSEEHKLKISNAVKSRYENYPNYRNKAGGLPIGYKFSLEHRAKLVLSSHKGETHHNWNGGSSFFPYCPRFNDSRKIATRNFFGNMCIVCGKHASEIKQKLHVHHIDHDKEQGCSGKPFNLVPLCPSCHARELNYKEEYKRYINLTLDAGFKFGIWSYTQYELEVMYPERLVELPVCQEQAITISGGM